MDGAGWLGSSTIPTRAPETTSGRSRKSRVVKGTRIGAPGSSGRPAGRPLDVVPITLAAGAGPVVPGSAEECGQSGCGPGRARARADGVDAQQPPVGRVVPRRHQPAVQRDGAQRGGPEDD